MFTGLIEALGTVESLRRGGSGARLEVAAPFAAELAPGESVAVDGACLTVAEVRGGRFSADVIPETLAHTTLGALRPGRKVHLERALRPGDRLGGHLVQGHVDAALPVLELARRGADVRLRVGLPRDLARYVALKGSVAVAGVSLTVAEAAGDRFGVALIPETLARTQLGSLRPGDRVNVEVDLLARYLERLRGHGESRG